MILIEFKNVNDALTKSTFFEKFFRFQFLWVFKFLRHVSSRQVLEYTLGSVQIRRASGLSNKQMLLEMVLQLAESSHS